MQKLHAALSVRILAAMLIATMSLVAGCGDASDEPATGKETEQARPHPEMRYLPYSIRFDLKGNPVIVDEKGRPAKMEPVEPPFKATSISDIQSISVVTYAGSCIQVYNIGGKLYSFSLPDAYCKSL